MPFVLAPFVIQLLIGAALSVAGTLASQLITGQQKREQRGLSTTFLSGGNVPQSILVGTIGLPGKLEHRATYGDSGGTPNAYLVDVISFGDVNITDITDFFVDIEDVTKQATGHTSLGYPVPEKLLGTSDHLWWEFYDGSQTTASPYLTSVFGSDPDRPWSSDMIGRGVPYMTMTARLNEKVWTDWPSYVFEAQGMALYDVRLDSTAGGSGSHDWANPATHAFTDNSLAIIYTLLRGVSYGGAHLWGGQATAYQFPYAEWAAALDACDEDIDLDGGGTEKQFRAGREIFVNERPADVVDELLTGAHSRIAMVAGRYYPLVGVPDSAAGNFTDDDVIVTDGTTLDCFPNLDSIINGATATYLEPSQAWQPKETAPHYRSDLEAEDDNRRQLTGFTLDTTFSGTQAQRILKAVVEESRRFRRHVVTLTPEFGQYRVLEALAWTSDANGYDAKLFLITSKTELPNGNVILGLQEIDPADYDWDAETDEQPIEFAPLTPIVPESQDTDGFDASAYAYVDAASNARRPGIMASWDGGLDDIRAVRVQVRLDGETEIIFDGEFSYDISEANPEKPIPHAFLPAEDYEVRGLYLPYDGSGRETVWSGWIAVTTPNVLLDSTELSLETQNRLSLVVGDIMDRLRDLRQRLGDLASAAIDAQYWTKRDVQQLLVNVGENSASITEERLVRISDDLALAQSIVDVSTSIGTAITAATTAITTAYTNADTALASSVLTTAASYADGKVGDVSADGLFAMESVAGPGGGWNRIALMSRASLGDAFVEAGDYWETKSDGSSRHVSKASQHYIVDEDDNIIALYDATGAYINTATITDLTAINIQTDGLNVSTIFADEVIIRGKAQDGAFTDLIESIATSGGTEPQIGADDPSGPGVVATNVLATINVPITDYPATVAAHVSISNTGPGSGTLTFYLMVAIGGTDILLQTVGGITIDGGADYVSLGLVSLPGAAGTYTFKLKQGAGGAPGGDWNWSRIVLSAAVPKYTT